jgi:hypothetical protein
VPQRVFFSSPISASRLIPQGGSQILGLNDMLAAPELFTTSEAGAAVPRKAGQGSVPKSLPLNLNFQNFINTITEYLRSIRMPNLVRHTPLANQNPVKSFNPD